MRLLINGNLWWDHDRADDVYGGDCDVYDGGGDENDGDGEEVDADGEVDGWLLTPVSLLFPVMSKGITSHLGFIS